MTASKYKYWIQSHYGYHTIYRETDHGCGFKNQYTILTCIKTKKQAEAILEALINAHNLGCYESNRTDLVVL